MGSSLYANISVEGATAIVANVWAESYLNPLQNQFEGGPGRGIVQWTNTERWSTYLNTFLPLFKAQNSTTAKYNWYDLDPQLCFIMDELVNYPFAKDKWASGFVDLPIGNASTCFCLVSDSVPEPDNMFNPCFKIF
jgi:Phage tail lysozyme